MECDRCGIGWATNNGLCIECRMDDEEAALFCDYCGDMDCEGECLDDPNRDTTERD